ncbi:MAG: hypothetical protein NVSMB55_21780 [Mycobacteriales bacterium]
MPKLLASGCQAAVVKKDRPARCSAWAARTDKKMPTRPMTVTTAAPLLLAIPRKNRSLAPGRESAARKRTSVGRVDVVTWGWPLAETDRPDRAHACCAGPLGWSRRDGNKRVDNAHHGASSDRLAADRRGNGIRALDEHWLAIGHCFSTFSPFPPGGRSMLRAQGWTGDT